ncbi:MAG: uroporphyrinogen-III synthase [Planctomycetota bacterium]|nr:uroporphyrinogen-III synthase [Planctomycetota bacterium]MDA1113707.1 uroporphyrinogen-III synthase [Planctomycetota bacterium]
METSPVLWIGRAEDHCVDWLEAASHAGWIGRALPLLQQSPLPLSSENSTLLRHLGEQDCLFITSRNGLLQWFDFCQSSGQLPSCKYAVIGTQSAALLSAGKGALKGRHADYVAPRRNGDSLAEVFLSDPVLGSLVFFGAETPRPELATRLVASGRSLVEVAAYRNQSLPGPPPAPHLPIFLFSPSGVESLVERVETPADYPVLAIGETTRDAAQAAQFPLFGCLEEPTPEALTEFLNHA